MSQHNRNNKKVRDGEQKAPRLSKRAKASRKRWVAEMTDKVNAALRKQIPLTADQQAFRQNHMGGKLLSRRGR